MKIIRSRKAFSKWRQNLKGSVGFVPTMGALHEGHLSLVKKSKLQNSKTVVSIFVNPTQFGPNEDLSKYPRTETQDLKLLRSLKVDAVFIPTVDQIYSAQPETTILPPSDLTEILEGRFRPGHFQGVATVVLKLFEIVQPARAYFGEKDFQQVCMIEQMVKDLFLPLQIIRCKTFREKTGLAMSSRNRYLSPELKLKASELYRSMRESRSIGEAKRRLKRAGFKLQYLEGWKGRWLVAAYFHGVRLIDNLVKN